MLRVYAVALVFGLAGAAGSSLAAPPMTAASINEAAPKGANDKDPSLIAKAEALLDRAHFSPGEIDALDGDNFRSAIRAFQEVHGLPISGNLDADTWKALAPGGSEPVLKSYTI